MCRAWWLRCWSLVFRDDNRADLCNSTPMREVAFDMKNILEALLPPGGVPRNISPYQNALLLEDSLGYVLPVPLETISSWKASKA
jgi:hypothetical protein